MRSSAISEYADMVARMYLMVRRPNKELII
jgi:hypothetical protein